MTMSLLTKGMEEGNALLGLLLQAVGGSMPNTRNFAVADVGTEEWHNWHVLVGLGLAENCSTLGEDFRSFCVTSAGLAFLQALDLQALESVN